MTVTAYASGDVAPQANPDVDPVLDLSAVALPQVVQLYGDGDDSLDPGAVWTWSWTILSGPVGHAAALNNSTIQNPTLTADVWGNYLVMLVVTNTNTPESSESNQFAAPSSALCVVRCLSANVGIQKPAPGERSYSDDLEAWADAIEASGGPTAHDLVSHTDVVTSTGPQLDVLTGQTYVDDPLAPGTPLHIHRGDEVDAATQLVRGAVLLEDPPLDPVNPRVVTQERITLTAHVSNSLGSSGTEAVILPHDTALIVQCHCHLFVEEDIEVSGWSVVLLDGGNSAPAIPYEFRLLAGDAAAVANGTMVELTGAASRLTGMPAVANEPLALFTKGLSLSQIKDRWIGLEVLNGDPGNPGRELTVTIYMRRRV